MKLEDKLLKTAYWVMIPTVMLTEKSKNKWIRVLGFFCCFPLCPLFILGLPFLILSVAVGTINDL